MSGFGAGICVQQHSGKRFGRWMRGSDEEFGIIVTANGRAQVKARCRKCGWRSGAIPYQLVIIWKLSLSDFTWARQNDPYEYEPCEVLRCTATVTEYHHFAPYNTFPGEADNWPGAYLCREHHFEWHRRMDGYRWHRKGVA